VGEIIVKTVCTVHICSIVAAVYKAHIMIVDVKTLCTVHICSSELDYCKDFMYRTKY
jgi:hypothetical protein